MIYNSLCLINSQVGRDPNKAEEKTISSILLPHRQMIRRVILADMKMSKALIEVAVLVNKGQEHYEEARTLYKPLYENYLSILRESEDLKHIAAYHLSKAPTKAIRQATEFVSSSCQGLIVVPITIKQFGVVSLAPIMREVNEELITKMRSLGLNDDDAREIRVGVHTCQSLPLTSTLQNVTRHAPTPDEVKKAYAAGKSSVESLGNVMTLMKCKAAEVLEDRQMCGLVRKGMEKMIFF